MNLYRKGFRAWRDAMVFGHGINITYFEQRDHDHLSVLVGATMRTIGIAETLPHDTFGLHLSHDEAQTLIDELWECGLRPTQGAGSAGQLSATERHLADLQRLVFKDRKP